MALPTGIPAIDHAVGVFSPFIGYDIGVIAHFHPDTAEPGRLSGASLGMRLAGGRWVQGDIAWSWPLSHPAGLQTPPPPTDLFPEPSDMTEESP